MNPKTKLHLHFVGIGGIGMSGIAEVLFNQGYLVSGSDVADSDTTRRLKELGIQIQMGHRAENIQDSSAVVISSAIRPTNPEVIEAKRRRIPVIPRAEMLGELMRGKTGIALAGTHGKTTTTSMLATIMTEAALDPTIVIGGKVNSLGGNAKLGQGQFVVAEADESDGSFLHLPATYAAITNIDNDHLDHFGNLEAMDEAFVEFVGKLPFYGMAAVCIDDMGVKRCVSRFAKPFKTYGTSEEAEYQAKNIELKGFGSTFDFYRQGNHLAQIQLSVPGRHNVLNALATLVIAEQLEVPLLTSVKGLRNFHGVKRRFEVRWQSPSGDQMVVEDYGHHPTEIQATLAAAREFWKGRVLTVFQPHRYTRTLHCWDGFRMAFQKCDKLWLTEIYAASEDPIEGVSAQALASAIRQQCNETTGVEFFGGDFPALAEQIKKEMRPGDLVLCMGAGSITKLPELLVLALDAGLKR